jgi:hypothetical protein
MKTRSLEFTKRTASSADIQATFFMVAKVGKGARCELTALSAG